MVLSSIFSVLVKQLVENLHYSIVYPTPSTHDIPRVFLRKNTYELFEREIRLKLTVVETADFGDQINKDDSFKVIGDILLIQRIIH